MAQSESEDYPNDISAPLDDENVSSLVCTTSLEEIDPLPGPVHPCLPKLARSAPNPLNPRPGHLQPPAHPPRGSLPSSSYDEISRELSDSVQAMVQTLLHLSPPHILDPVEELFSTCTVQLPAPSVSALLTTMKNLKFLSANLKALAPGAYGTPHDDSLAKEGEAVLDSFDIGGVVQCVGDVLGGVAAQAGVDLAIFHGDVGMRHIDVIGDEQSILFILTHITRQILATARSGDAIEIGLHLTSLIQCPPQADDPLNTAPGEIVTPNSVEVGTPISCTFEITHTAKTPAEGTNPPSRRSPKLDSIIIKRLLARTSTSLIVNSPPATSLVCDTTYSLTTQLVRGPTLQHDPNPSSPSPEDDEIGTTKMSARTMPLAKEPALEELAIFFEASLRGKRAVFHAQESSTFARHLTSYLTSWGLDVGHMPIGGPAIDHAGRPSGRAAKSVEESDGRLGADNAPSPIDVDPAAPPLPPPPSSDVGEMRPAESAAQIEPSFIIIDDDVDVLGRVLNHRRREVSTMTRPPLAQYHRPRSSPQVRQVLGIDANEKQPSESRPVQESRGSIILHITSLAKYKLVLDTVQSTLFLVPPSRIPDIMVIPKPAGPRRFLTALYAAVRRSSVDPYISPIATSPQSPGTVSLALGNITIHSDWRHTWDQRPGSTTSPTTNRPSQQTNHSPGEGASFGNKSPRGEAPPSIVGSSSQGTPQASPESVTDSLGYFAPTSVKMGSSASSGVVLQSPDGRATGIYFQPHRSSTTPINESGLGTPLTRSSRSHMMDNRPGNRYPSGTSSRFIEENRSALLRDRRTSSEAIASSAAPSRSRRHTLGEGDPATPMITSLPRSIRSRPGSSRSRPTSAGSSRDANSPSSAPHSNVPATRVVTSPRNLPGSRHMPDDSALPSAGPKTSTPSLSSPVAHKFMPVSANSHSAQLAIGPSEAPAAEASASVALAPSTGSAPPIASHAPSKIVAKLKKFSGSGAGKGTKVSNGITPPISVLIAEDNPINQTILTTFMRRRKLKYATANNGAEAVEKWRTGQYHLILMDIQMPLMDGIDATKEIRRLERSVTAPMNSPTDRGEVVAQGHPTVPSTPFHASVIIVALTASSLQSDRVKALAAGCNDFLTKPVSLHWLDKKIIEWGSIKALQMWASPELTYGVHEVQDARASVIDLHLPQRFQNMVPSMEARSGLSVSSTVVPEVPRQQSHGPQK